MDLATFSVIVVWTFILFSLSLLVFISFFFPLFIIRVKVYTKLSLFAYLFQYFQYLRIKTVENAFVFYAVLDAFRKLFR